MATGPKPVPDRLALGAKLGGNACDGSARRAQPCGVLVADLPPGQGGLAAPRRRARQRAVRLGCRCWVGRRALLFAGLLRRTADGGMMAAGHGADGIAEVAQQVPAVRHLDRIRRALAHAVRVGAGPVARDDLDPGVLTEPPGQGFALPVGQQVHEPIALQVDQGRPVAVATAPGPIINGEGARRGRRLAIIAGRAGHPQQRVGADRHGQPFGQAPAGLAAERMGEMALQVAQPLGPACGCRRDPGQALGEGLAGTGGVEAAEPPCLDLQRHWTALPGQVGKRALVAAMEPLERLGASGANGRQLTRARCDDDVIGGGHDLHDGEAGRDQGQDARGQGKPSTRGCSVLLTCSSNPETTAREVRENPKFDSRAREQAEASS